MTGFIKENSFVICLIGAAGLFIFGLSFPAFLLLTGHLCWDLFRTCKQGVKSPSAWLGLLFIDNALRLSLILFLLCLAVGNYSAIFLIIIYAGAASIWRAVNKRRRTTQQTSSAPNTSAGSDLILRRIPSLKMETGIYNHPISNTFSPLTKTSRLFMAIAYCGGLVQAVVLSVVIHYLHLKTTINVLDDSLSNYLFLAVLSAPFGYILARRLRSQFTPAGLVVLLAGWPILQLVGSITLSMVFSGFLIAVRNTYDETNRISTIFAALIFVWTGASLTVRFIKATLTDTHSQNISSNLLIEIVIFLTLAIGAMCLAIVGDDSVGAITNKFHDTPNRNDTPLLPIAVAAFGFAALIARLPQQKLSQWWQMVIRPIAFAMTLICLLKAGQLMFGFFDLEPDQYGWLILLIPAFLIKAGLPLVGIAVFGLLAFWPYGQTKLSR
ncbi:hypothetical protein AEAC466_20370 [Asticcacaulis sp. AC466]|uniref:hypothetical protein n=1 Tax=Asticcacaulis sp. AC466 TaxID=1282362 RepID=UPI0003C3F25B|nr:hypothetical protein [Asticcacaulis sp. AC466]ESQ81780.1 hypothetical protein AEAC466_20370 [Asticcacaulis sp. AC466]